VRGQDDFAVAGSGEVVLLLQRLLEGLVVVNLSIHLNPHRRHKRHNSTVLHCKVQYSELVQQHSQETGGLRLSD